MRNWTPKIFALVVIGCTITVLFIKGIVGVSRHDFRPAAWYLIAGVVLFAVFFRHRKFAFTTIALSFLIVMAGPTAIFHPTALGVLITLGSSLGLYALVVFGTRRYPSFEGKDWKALYDRDPE